RVTTTWQRVWWPVCLPLALLLAGALLGLPWTLDAPVARERLWGILAAGLLAPLAALGVQRLERPAAVLLAASALAAFGALFVIAASGPDAFVGPLSGPLLRLFAPLFGQVQLSEPVQLTDTRFIVGYNGLA